MRGDWAKRQEEERESAQAAKNEQAKALAVGEAEDERTKPRRIFGWCLQILTALILVAGFAVGIRQFDQQSEQTQQLFKTEFDLNLLAGKRSDVQAERYEPVGKIG